ncbi:MAG: FHA domain-containing protein [Actinomycetaceae bacterium]|jgi:hypothetical protein|nr:FHA domain-containing protein [Actinomycetaceae bacterium]
MSTLVLTLLRFGFLALLWLFVFAVVITVRKDVYGSQVRDRRRRVPRRDSAPPPAPQPQKPTPRAPTLAVTGGPLAGTTLPLGQASIVVGRSPDSALVLDDTYSSSRHARIYHNDGQWWIEDLDSTNGTFVSGKRINAPTPLPPGASIVIGKTTMELRR